jgi:putative lipoprotein
MRIAILLPSCLAAFLPGCQHSPPSPGHGDAILGTVTYLEEVALPIEARLRVMLLDIDAPDVPDFILAKHESAILRDVPIQFDLPYDPRVIRADVLYGVSAEILVGDEVWFEMPEPVPVLTKGNPGRVELVLHRSE